MAMVRSGEDAPSVEEILDRAGPRRDDAVDLLGLHVDVTGEEPAAWGARIIGFGTYEYRYESGRSGQAPLLAFAPGKSHQTLYLVEGFATRWPDRLAAVGPHRASSSCLSLTRMARVDRSALRDLMQHSLEDTRRRWG